MRNVEFVLTSDGLTFRGDVSLSQGINLKRRLEQTYFCAPFNPIAI